MQRDPGLIKVRCSLDDYLTNHSSLFSLSGLDLQAYTDLASTWLFFFIAFIVIIVVVLLLLIFLRKRCGNLQCMNQLK